MTIAFHGPLSTELDQRVGFARILGGTFATGVLGTMYSTVGLDLALEEGAVVPLLRGLVLLGLALVSFRRPAPALALAAFVGSSGYAHVVVAHAPSLFAEFDGFASIAFRASMLLFQVAGVFGAISLTRARGGEVAA